VRKMGGYISVESEEEVGSTFRVVLPVLPVVEEDRADDSNHPTQLSGHVLLVEDAVDSARYISLLLDTIGLVVAVAPTAEECLRQIEEGERYDVILMDIGLPGMDGLSAIRELRSRNIEIPILALSAHAFEEDVDACLAAGADGYLTKPFRVQDFLRSVAARLGGSAQSSGSPSPEDTVVRTAVGNRPSTEARLQEIRHRFVSGLLQNLARIRNAELSENWIDVREVVHKMAGSAGLLGYTQLSDKARDAEIAIKRGDTPLLAGMIDDLEREVRRIVGNAGATDNNAREAH